MHVLKALTFAAAGVDVSDTTNFQRIDSDYDESPGTWQDGLSLVSFLKSSTNVGSAVLQLALVRVNAAGAAQDVAARFHSNSLSVVTTDRDVLAGATGNYLVPVTWALSGKRFIDLAGAGYEGGRKPGTAGYEWRIGVESVSTVLATALTLLYKTLRNV
jgi:hypothetical protein